MRKQYRLHVHVPEAVIEHAHQHIVVEAWSLPVAVRRGLEDILRRDGLRRKRVRTLHLTVVVGQATEAEPDSGMPEGHDPAGERGA